MPVQLIDFGFLRQRHILGDTKAVPPILPILPIGKSKFRADIQAGLFTPPIKIGARASAWPAPEVRDQYAARVAGATDDQLRALVKKLVAARRVAIDGGAS